MNRPPPVIIVDDDADEYELVKEAWEILNLDYPLIFFSKALQLLDYIKAATEIPFLIISDINLPGMNGFEMREKILQDDDARCKSVPFVFWSGSATDAQILKAYDLSSHGFFIKATSFDEFKETMKDIITYWQKSEIPFLHEK